MHRNYLSRIDVLVNKLSLLTDCHTKYIHHNYGFFLQISPVKISSLCNLLHSQHRLIPKHIMMTSSNENIFRVTGHLCGEFTGPGEFPTQRPVTRSFDVYFDLCPNKRLSKQWWGWWFETLSCSLWRHRNVLQEICMMPKYMENT